jgi:hypothetical protein
MLHSLSLCIQAVGILLYLSLTVHVILFLSLYIICSVFLHDVVVNAVYSFSLPDFIVALNVSMLCMCVILCLVDRHTNIYQTLYK